MEDSDIPENFEYLETIGIGSFGNVYKVRDIVTHEIFALKAMSKKHLYYKNLVQSSLNEKTVLLMMDHPGIIKLYMTLKDDTNIYFVLEYCENGDMDGLMKRFHSFNEKVGLYIFAQIVESLSYMHDMLIINGDIKLENILFDGNWNAKLCDFNKSVCVQSSSDVLKNHVGTPQYMPPENVKTGEYGFSGDVWSLGCILYFILKGISPFKAETDYLSMCKVKAFKNIKCLDIEGISTECVVLLNMMLEKEPNLRIKVNDIKSMPLFKDYLWNNLYTRPSILKLCVESYQNSIE